MSRLVFGKKSCQLQRPRVDRFIPPRESFADERRRGSWHSSSLSETVNIWDPKYRKQKNYKKRLHEVFGLESEQDAEFGPVYDQACLQPWPCVPRKKGYLSSVDSILDLPTYSYATFPEILDWSSTNMLVAALQDKYYMYSWNSQSVRGQGVTWFPIHCCKFNPLGDRLLIGSDVRIIEIHDSVLTKKIQLAKCRCMHDEFELGFVCSITAADWSPTGNTFVTGCSLGMVTTYDTRSTALGMARILNWWRQKRTPILSVKISPNARFVAILALNSPMVRVLKWPSLESHSDLSSDWIIKTIAWHPWRSALLAVGLMTSTHETTLALWDTASLRVREAKLGLGNHYCLDVMLFSHRTGELVLSMWNTDRAVSTQKTCAQLLVMSDTNTVVDQSGEGNNVLDRVRTMVFSPDGTKLATATADEDLIIWNFLPDKKTSKNTKSKRFYAMPVYLDQFTYGYSVR